MTEEQAAEVASKRITWDMFEQILDILREIAELLKSNFQLNELKSMAVKQPEQVTPWHKKINHVPTDGEVNTMASKTIPDQSLSIPELMTRYARGLPLEGKREPFFDEDPENPMPDLTKMDIIDQHETIQAARDEIRDIANKYKTEQEKKKQEAYDEYKRKYDELDKKFKDHLTGSEKDKSPTAPL